MHAEVKTKNGSHFFGETMSIKAFRDCLQTSIAKYFEDSIENNSLKPQDVEVSFVMLDQLDVQSKDIVIKITTNPYPGCSTNAEERLDAVIHDVQKQLGARWSGFTIGLRLLTLESASVSQTL